ncbi:MAG: Tex family protein [Planctomycetaceae bacterium]
MAEGVQIDFPRLARELGLRVDQVIQTAALADEGNTVPFITRYRKEQTGHLDEEQIRAVLTRVQSERQLQERIETILRNIESQGKLTPDLAATIRQAASLKQLEDLYLPYKPRRQTRAQAARERGLEPLALQVLADLPVSQLQAAARQLVSPEKQLPTTDAVWQGVCDLLAEIISERADLRETIRRLAWKTGRIKSVVVDARQEAATPFRDYFDHSELVSKIPPHRILAFNRGEGAGVLRVHVVWDDDQARQAAENCLQLGRLRNQAFVRPVVADALDRLVHPSLEREIRRELTAKASAQAVSVFARNLRKLLLQPPVQGQSVLAIDPGFRTGCKVAILDATGRLLTQDLVYCTGAAEKLAATRARLAELLREHGCRLIAIGNGTACRETEELVAQTIAEHVPDARYLIVNEAGASIYSTSPVAREEFPELDATVRGTISIGRRVQDPLSELVKIEPQHIGVGMYQHDVDSGALQTALDEVVESCVNLVGVDLNTASVPLLARISGLNPATARRIVDWRCQHGPFRSRAQLREVPGIGPAKFTQAAGFLKIRDGIEPLDATWIHPESYTLARKVLQRCPQVMASATAPRTEEAMPTAVELEALAKDLQAGLPTLRDIVDSLSRPGRDPRSDLPGPLFRQDVLQLSDLVPGMELRGTVLNVVDFGAFIDVGLKDSGLVHISQMSTEFIRSPHEKVSVGDVITVWVQAVDLQRRRVSLTMLPPGTPPGSRSATDRAVLRSQEASADSAMPVKSGGVAPSRPSPSPIPPPAASSSLPSANPSPQGAPPSKPTDPLRSIGQLQDLLGDRNS